jgi:hypothetical protein
MRFKNLKESVHNIIDGSSVYDQIDVLLEMAEVPPPIKKQGWWPPKNSRHGEPLSAEFWGMVMQSVLKIMPKARNKDSGLRRVAREWENMGRRGYSGRFAKTRGQPARAASVSQITLSLIKEFMKAAGIYDAYVAGTLDTITLMNVFDGAERGSGIWTAGTKDTMLKKPYSGRIPRIRGDMSTETKPLPGKKDEPDDPDKHKKRGSK